MEKPQWRATALAMAAAVLLGFSASDANALALGRITVQSALGEPLRAEIDIPEINAEELANLRTTIATPDAFRAAGLEYNPALATIRISVERRPNGNHFLSLSSPRAVNEPFMDLILETSWASGRIVRDYTMLFDPPSLRPSPAPLAAQVAPVAPAARISPTPAPPPTAAAPAAAPRAEPSRPAAPPRPAAGTEKKVTIKTGDTAGKIAAAHKPPSVSLDQMLVALLRTNPDAFIGGNINRLRSGAVLDIPSEEQASQTPAGQARETVIAQSRDFNEFRRRLAEGAPTTAVAQADRQTAGKVQTQVQEKKAAAATPDKLTLSKGSVQGSAAEDKIARERAARDASVRVAELNKNLSDLNKLGSAVGTAPASAARSGVAVPVGAGSAARPAASAAASPASARASAAVATPAVATPASAAAAPTASASAASPASAALAASAPATPAMAAASQAPAASASKPRPAPARVETSLLDDLLENPVVPATAGGVLALLAGFIFYRVRQRKKSTQVDSSFLESRLQPDSFFGASGGQRVNTSEGPPSGSSMVYSPSQLDAAGDVDPVAEADVYLAYGRDLQAEEILKEALRTAPQRVAIHSKLLEIYAKRRDVKGFEFLAAQAHGLTQGQGPEWEHICELGLELDPSNNLYRPGGQPAEGAATAAAAAAAVAVATAAAAEPSGSFGATTATQAIPEVAGAPGADLDLDLDLDFSLDDEPAAPQAAPEPTQVLSAAPAAEPMPSLDMDFGAQATQPIAAAPVPQAPTLPQPEPTQLEAPDLTLDQNALSFTVEAPTPAAPAPAASAPAPSNEGMIEFDLGSLSLDLDTPAKDEAASTEAPKAAGADDPLATKLALAEEFKAIGDEDGARGLAQEVLAEASGELKSRAERFLADIG